jgi:hypothetical protein
MLRKIIRRLFAPNPTSAFYETDGIYFTTHRLPHETLEEFLARHRRHVALHNTPSS